jgi:Fur family transcriptional regulator, ferric uptake regulator
MSQDWDDTLRASGYRVTPQRQLVLESVSRLEHATPEEIFADVRQTARGVNVSTVYRTLELLEHVGLVTHTHLSHGAPRYHLAAEAEHVHLVCQHCGRIIELDKTAAAPLVAALDQTEGFLTDVGHLTVFGLCAACRTAGVTGVVPRASTAGVTGVVPRASTAGATGVVPRASTGTGPHSLRS